MFDDDMTSEDWREAFKIEMDDRYGEGTMEMLEATRDNTHTQEQLAQRFNLSQSTVSHRINTAMTWARRIARKMRTVNA